MVDLSHRYNVDKDGAEYDYLRLCDAPLSEDVLEFLGKSHKSKSDGIQAIRERVYA
ncbi:hypothetical protein [Bifidobacterium jacchi]|uniref:hypothetical protein n=1 Tax=Bifidobacterium jacchi TaxID=2490545 RepID=UPI0015881B65|nr:hypothetical protein [Bifidobacterium jacchi]